MKIKCVFLTALFAAFLLCLVSCIDYVQSLSYKNGDYSFYYKIALSKLLFAMADEDPESVFDDSFDDAFSDLPDNVAVNKVNTDLEVGAEIRMTISRNTKDADEAQFLPTVERNKITIPFLLGSVPLNDNDSPNDDDAQMFATAILASAKCRVLLAKNIAPSIEAAYFEGNDGQNYPVPVFDYGETFCLEIPFIILFDDDGAYDFENIIVIKNE